jgi:hypothetical protein
MQGGSTALHMASLAGHVEVVRNCRRAVVGRSCSPRQPRTDASGVLARLLELAPLKKKSE